MDIIEILLKVKTYTGFFVQTEADTRARIIDPILDSLGWIPSAISREPYAGWSESKGYIDYLLFIRNKPYLVIEAKKTGRTFELPARLAKQRFTTFRSLKAISNSDLNEALEQCMRYTMHCGAQYACATNGFEWLFFKPTHPHRPLPDAKVAIFPDIESILKNIDLFSDLLACEQLEGGAAEQHLVGKTLKIPRFSKRLADLFPYRPESSFEVQEYTSLLESFLQYFIEDLQDDEVFDKCYVSVAVNLRTAGFIDAIIENKVAEVGPATNIAQGTFSKSLFKKSEYVSQSKGRLIVLHGPMGVGKSSFLRGVRLKINRCHSSAIWAQINLVDFRDRPFDPQTTTDMLNLICRQLQDSVAEAAECLAGHFNPDEWSHLRDIYSTEMRKFHDSKYPDCTDDNVEYLKEARQYIWDLKEKDPHEHLLRVIRWFTEHCHLPVVIALDNSDQLGLEFQEFLYKVAEGIQLRTQAVVILVLRTEALASHRIKQHALASVHEQYAINKAPLSAVLQRRFSAMSDAIQSKQDGITPQEQILVDRLLSLMDTIGYEAEVGSETFIILDSIGNDSIRDALRAVSAIFRHSPKFMDKLVADQARDRRTRLRPDAVMRAIMKNATDTPDSRSLIPNIFYGDASVLVPYSLCLRIMQQVRSRSSLGQYYVKDLFGDFMSSGMDRDVLQRSLDKLIFDRVISVPHMLEITRDVDPLRLTKLGDGLLSVMLFKHIYYEQFAFDSIIYDEQKFIDMRSVWNSRAEVWKRYVRIGESFIDMIKKDDKSLRDNIIISMLEPIVGMDFLFPAQVVDDH